jgi:biopolymer transport protein ExbD
MKFGRQMQGESEGIPMTPLIDIVFLTLIFFMVTSTYGALESEIDIALPTAQTAETSERAQGEIIINVRADGVIVVNEREMDAVELESVLKRVAEYFPGGAVIVRGDRHVSWAAMMQVLDACGKADIQNISFGALSEEQQGGQP